MNHRKNYVTMEVSIGDFCALRRGTAGSGLVDAIGRLLPVCSTTDFALFGFFRIICAPPVYTHAGRFPGLEAPEVLLSAILKIKSVALCP